MTIVIVKISIPKVKTAVLTNLQIFGENSSHKASVCLRGGGWGWNTIWQNSIWTALMLHRAFPQWFIVSVLEIAIASLSFVSLFLGVKILKPWSWRCILHIDTHSTHLFLHEKCIDKICTTNIRPSVEYDWIISAWYASQIEE